MNADTPFVTDGIKTVEDAHKVIEICNAHIDAAPMHSRRERLVEAMNSAVGKLDRPRRDWRTCDGTKESHRQLLRRINWLRNKTAEAA